ncbi:HAD-IA family hydrolase [Corynebacterium aquatimens]|uniref:HAD-IA family hydrolase n=1 Tax=Corynebacterium TaxID=1716 RepID=UPI001F324696|nr:MULTISPECIES: HAD-IA family hydrolase [Corynebacterium]QYH19440.1 HAD-IA family hydrolase [Corynebacterium aquatimens]UIZ91642.1 HAD-IA family hydrolase [Corynebacterium sp. CNCTC7651]
MLDVDGTLIDSFPGIREGFVRALDSIGHPLPDDQFLARIPGPPMRESMAAAGLDPEQVARAMRVYSDFMSTEGWRDFTVFDGVLDLVAEWKAEGLGVVTATSKSERFARLALEEAGIMQHIDFLGAANPDAGRVTKIEVIRHVLDSVDPPHPIMVGDRIHDFEGAAEFGIPSVAVTWGYGTEEEWAQANHIARSPEALKEIVKHHVAGE